MHAVKPAAFMDCNIESNTNYASKNIELLGETMERLRKLENLLEEGLDTFH